MKITQSSGLKTDQLRSLADLLSRCIEKDGHGVRIYWHIISKPRPIPGDFCVYSDDGELIAYLSIFLFNAGEAEITAMIDPEYRQHGLFKKLLTQALQLIKSMELHTVVFSCPAQCATTLICLTKYEASHRLSEYDLHWNPKHPLYYVKNPLYEKRLAKASDLGAIIELDAVCLHDDPEKIEYHLHQTIYEKDREIWLLYDMDNFVGKIHLHFLGEVTFIHNICIKPEYQGKGYGYYFLNNIMNELTQSGRTDLRMEVEAPNERALSLYLRLGFEIAEQYDFWETALPFTP
jgi:ribosomal protein S18 acetylase RimI-like enzyme